MKLEKSFREGVEELTCAACSLLAGAATITQYPRHGTPEMGKL